MLLHDLSEFFKLSSALNYNLSAASLNRYNVLMFIIGDKRLHPKEKKDLGNKAIVMEALSYLFNAYSQKRRRLGPVAVLHPLRAAALFARAHDQVGLMDLLSLLFHDILEDIQPTDFSSQKWKGLEAQLFGLISRLGPTQELELIERLDCLTRRRDETYYQYIWRLLGCAHPTKKLVRVKLADRLDNTLDMRIAIQDPLEGIDFFENIFQLLFSNTYSGYVPKIQHPPTEALNGAKRLFQLFKNAVLLSLIRQKIPLNDDPASLALFDALATASIKEAQRTFIHVAGYHLIDVPKQRSLLLKSMDYCYSGRSDLITKPADDQLLDGLFTTYFAPTSNKIRNQRLDELYGDKSLMIQASLAFLTIFLNFLNDPGFYVQGISASGIKPQ